jgi:MFS family permease
VLAAVAGGYVIAALVAGPVGDRFGLARTILVASLVYGVGFLLGGLAQEWHHWLLVPIFFVAIAGGAVMTLAWGLLFTLMPEEHRGAVSGLATTTKGIGLIVGPLAAGAAIDLVGYRALWPLCGVLVLSSVPLVALLSGRRARPAA